MNRLIQLCVIRYNTTHHSHHVFRFFVVVFTTTSNHIHTLQSSNNSIRKPSASILINCFGNETHESYNFRWQLNSIIPFCIVLWLFCLLFSVFVLRKTKKNLFFLWLSKHFSIHKLWHRTFVVDTSIPKSPFSFRLIESNLEFDFSILSFPFPLYQNV